MDEFHSQPTSDRQRSNFFTSLLTLKGDSIDTTQRNEARQDLLPKGDNSPFQSSSRDIFTDTKCSISSASQLKAFVQEKWSPLWNMYLFLVLGTAFAISHHAYYQSFQGASVFNNEQLNTMRYGTVLAFAAKSCLVFAVMSAFREQIWLTFSNKFLRVTTLNGMFAVPETPLSLLNLEFLRKAKIAAALAIYCW